MLEKLNRINLLYDIYGPLLTTRQQEVLRLYFSDNLSLGEIAAEYTISRQAVYDLIRRALAAMEDLETKLGLYKLFQFQQERLHEAGRILEQSRLGVRERDRLRAIIRELKQEIEQ